MIEALTRYLDKCRCCYNSLEIEDNSSLINKIIEKRFYFLARLEVSEKKNSNYQIMNSLCL